MRPGLCEIGVLASGAAADRGRVRRETRRGVHLPKPHRAPPSPAPLIGRIASAADGAARSYPLIKEGLGTITTNVHRPTPLREFIDAGGTPISELADRSSHFVEMLVDVDIRTAHAREHCADSDEYHVECSLRGEAATHGRSWGDGQFVREPITEEAMKAAPG
jgi:hypothetical protein